LMADHWRHGPDRTVERPAIGRRSSECQVDCVNLLLPGPVTPFTPPAEAADELPTAAELLQSVREFLRGEAAAEGSERARFLARVAANSLEIVEREMRHGARLQAREHARLTALLEQSGELTTLRWQLVQRLRNGALPLNDSGLVAHLRETVVQQALIDQPHYPGVRLAVGERP